MDIHLIWAQDFNGGIGKNGQLPWHIPEDLKNFKKLTLNSTIIMGRKTWDSLPFKPLPKRRNIILSRNKSIDIFGDSIDQETCNVEVYSNVVDCISVLKNESIDKVFIIGGSSIYKLFFDYANQLHITFINISNAGIKLDTVFPVKMNIIKQIFTKKSTQIISEHAEYTHWVKK